jgi:hypothetical protein
MFEVAGQRAAAAIGVVVLRARQSIIKQQHHALCQSRGEACDPGIGQQAHLRGVARRQRFGQLRVQFLHGGRQRRIRRALRPGERAIRGERHAEFLDRRWLRAARHEAPTRQCIEHLVRQDDAAHAGIGQLLQPAHPRLERFG